MEQTSFVGCELSKTENGSKIRLPAAWTDGRMFKKTIPYERIAYTDKNGNDVAYFRFYPVNAVDGSVHTGKPLTRITDDGSIILPEEAKNDAALKESVYLIGMGDYIEMRFEKPEDYNDSFYEETSLFLELFGY